MTVEQAFAECSCGKDPIWPRVQVSGVECVSDGASMENALLERGGSSGGSKLSGMKVQGIIKYILTLKRK